MPAWCTEVQGVGFFSTGVLPERENVLLFTCVMLMRSDSRVRNALLSHRATLLCAKAPHAQSHTCTCTYRSLSLSLLCTQHPPPPPISLSWDQPAARTTIHGFDPESNTEGKQGRMGWEGSIKIGCFCRKIEEFPEADKISLALLKTQHT